LSESYCLRTAAKLDELIPCKGKDTAYDEVQAKIKNLEKQLEDELRRLEKQSRSTLASANVEVFTDT